MRERERKKKRKEKDNGSVPVYLIVEEVWHSELNGSHNPYQLEPDTITWLTSLLSLYQPERVVFLRW